MAESSRCGRGTSSTDSYPRAAGASGYGRARLWLGISAVGTLVTLAIVGLFLDLPDRIQQNIDSTIEGQARGILWFVLIYAGIHLPFDLFGGHILPRRLAGLTSISHAIFSASRGA